MKRFILACLLALPFAAMALPSQEAVRQVVLKGVNDPASAKFAKETGEAGYTINGREVVIYCGAVNAKNAAGKYVGDHMYFVAYFIDDADAIPVAVAIAHPSELTAAMNEALDRDDNDPRKVIVEQYAKCIIRMLDKR